MTVTYNITVSVAKDQPFRLIPCYARGLHWFQIQGSFHGLSIFANEDHPEAHRLPAAVAAFNAVMDAKEVKP
jgi:hypothetical protein